MKYIDGFKAGSVFQLGFTTKNLHETLAHFVDNLGIGPWFVAEDFAQPLMIHRGTETPDLQTAVGFGYWGDMQYEIVEQRDAGPSVFRDVYETTGYGFHHMAFFTEDYDKQRQHFVDKGAEIAFEARTVPELGGKRAFYADTRSTLGVMTEVGEYCEPVASLFVRMHEASQGWDGRDPYRPITSLF